MRLKTYIIKKYCEIVLRYLIIILISIYFLSYFLRENLLESFARIGNLFYRMYPLDISILPQVLQSLIETISIAFFSSIFALVTSLVILPFTNNFIFNISTFPKVVNILLSVFRTLPSLIIASILVALFGVGKFSGFLALYFISTLMATKILKEYSEEVAQRHLDSAKCLGLTTFNLYYLAIVRNIKDKIFSVFFLTLESNIRGASILGLVGAGGIGQLLWKELNHLRYDRVALIILLLVVTIGIIDLSSYYFRHKKDRIVTTFKIYRRNTSLKKMFYIILLLGSLLYVIDTLNLSEERLNKGLLNIKIMFKSMLIPDFTYFNKAILALGDSILVAIAASLFASLTTIIIAYFSVSKISNINFSILSKLLVNIFRTVPPVIVAIIFFRGFGPGFIASFFALYFYTLGVTNKMFMEILEAMEENLLFSVKSMGISSFIAYIKIIFTAYIPEFVSIVLFRFEMNIKNSAILGMVGVGGIGQLIVNNIEFRNWSRISLLLLILTLSIVIIERISYYIRMKIKE
ncbi:ABC transporter permease subunit [Gemella sp. GL1.1]|nr:ABC transporter permease subunit [Gemella sp. GL1.1]MBF0746503.1 ABC transporter permease subunit [Gemella sp. 19428wG2_WT2a]NYS27547.1 ABC transporter permease subunit [Gemella sp. GL1]TFU60323.1 ABC transporter permease subunit [Gemella sp. WT2a]